MENKELYEKYKNFNQERINTEFHCGCFGGNINLVKFLLTYPELEYHAIIQNENNFGLRFACNHGHVEVVKYLLTSPELNSEKVTQKKLKV